MRNDQSSEETIMFCEVHRKMYFDSWTIEVLNISEKSCCETLFESKPFFTLEGTCFSTKIDIEEKLAGLFESFQIVAWNPAKHTPGNQNNVYQQPWISRVVLLYKSRM